MNFRGLKIYILGISLGQEICIKFLRSFIFLDTFWGLPMSERTVSNIFSATCDVDKEDSTMY